MLTNLKEGGLMNEMERLEYIAKMAENLPTLRTKLNMTQEELANLIGVSRSTVILFEKGQRSMTWNTFLSLILIFSKNSDTNKLMKALDIYTDELEEILGGNQ
ncbi:MAG TPA: hypothetical protein DEB10_02870 [Ruminococcaceae bacterium]|jgi:DNA-binding XRE family transcriptional regulator|nr:hypothetical protein [Oscillospiraceae bacterium]